VNFYVAVVIEGHLIIDEEGKRSDVVVQSGSGLTRTNVDQVSLATRT
jgi:hypothetical protein